MTDLTAEKKAARAAAHARRADLHADGAGAARQAAGHVLEAIGRLREARCVAGYLPMRSELDPLPAMLALHGLGVTLCAPKVEGPGRPLAFRRWRPGAPIAKGHLGEPYPAEDDPVEPDVILAPLLAFDAAGRRLGYGGGFYDRTLAALRARRPVAAFGFAYAGQQVAAVPHGPTDAPLDAIVTERGVLVPA